MVSSAEQAANTAAERHSRSVKSTPRSTPRRAIHSNPARTVHRALHRRRWQIPIASRVSRLVLFNYPAGSFIGGFRTPAPVQPAARVMAGVPETLFNSGGAARWWSSPVPG